MMGFYRLTLLRGGGSVAHHITFAPSTRTGLFFVSGLLFAVG